MADGVMDFNWLGVAFVSEDIPDHGSVEEAIWEKSEELRAAAMTQFDQWLASQDLEQIMGVIVRKGTVKQGQK